ncbi:MAG: hypothetical protein ACPG8V_05720 [Alphaproteobacteria bacterium]
MKKQLLALALLGSLSACGNGSPDMDNKAKIFNVTVESKAQVMVAKDTSGVGEFTGGVIGYAVADSIGGSDLENVAISIGAAAAGSEIGESVEKETSEKVKAFKYIVKKKDDSKVKVVVKNGNLKIGDKAVLTIGKKTSLKLAK